MTSLWEILIILSILSDDKWEQVWTMTENHGEHNSQLLNRHTEAAQAVPKDKL